MTKGSPRLTRREKYGLNKHDRTLLYYRNHPVQAARDILDFHPIWYQRQNLRGLWKTPNVFMLMGRGTSKTSSLALYYTLKAMLFPGMKIGHFAPSLRQANYVFDYIDEFYINSPFLRNSLLKRAKDTGKASSRGVHGTVVKFQNGSYIEGMPLSDGSTIRGRRYWIIGCDEYAFMPEEVINHTLRPMAIIRKAGMQNQWITAGTAWYKINHMWPHYVHMLQMSQKEPELYNLFEYNYMDLLMTKDSPFMIDETQLKFSQEEMPTEVFEMEYLVKFPDDLGAYFSARLLSSCTPDQSPIDFELIGNKRHVYVVGVDVARKEGGSDFALQVLKVIGNERHLVYSLAFNGKDYPTMVNVIRRVVKDFPVAMIGIDAGGGGLTLKDYLARSWIDPTDGKEEPPLLDMDDSLHQTWDGLQICRYYNFTIPLINEMYTKLKADFEHRRLLFPLHINKVVKEEDKPYEEVSKDMFMTKLELQTLTPVQTTWGVKFERAVTRFKKDRATALALANKVVHDLDDLKKSTRATPTIGYWVGPAFGGAGA